MDNSHSASDTLIAFEAIAWSSPMPGMRTKEAKRDGQVIRLIELDETFVEPTWCRKGHVGFVIEGTLEIDFGERTIQFHAGDALCIPSGEATQHKARSVNGTTLLFVVDQH